VAEELAELLLPESLEPPLEPLSLDPLEEPEELELELLELDPLELPDPFELYPSEYQPLPLRMKRGAEIRRCAFARQILHRLSGSSVMRCTTSKVWPFVHSYSYVGMCAPSPLDSAAT